MPFDRVILPGSTCPPVIRAANKVESVTRSQRKSTQIVVITFPIHPDVNRSPSNVVPTKQMNIGYGASVVPVR